MDLKPLEKARAAARQAVRDAEAIVQASAASDARARKRILRLENALVEVKKHHAVTAADERRLTQLALTEPLEIQRGIVEEMKTAVTRLHVAVMNAQWNLQVESAQGADGAIAKARAALARMRVHAGKAEALSPEALARREAKLITRLDSEMKKVKMAVAVTIADEKRLLAARDDGPDPFWSRRLRPPDPETMARVMGAQHAAVEELKQQLRDVNDRVEAVKRRARIEAARRRLPE